MISILHQKNDKMSLGWRAKLSLGLILITLSTIFIITVIRENKRNINRILDQKELAIASLMESLIEQVQETYTRRIMSFAKLQNNSLAAMAKGDRETLLRETMPIFKILKSENPAFGTMHFFRPDNTTILRLHRPELYDDDLTELRPLIAEVNRVKEQRSGYEVGLSGMFFRVTQPLFYEGKYIGGLEFGISLDGIINTLREKINPDIAPLLLSTDWQKVSLVKLKSITMGRYSLLPLDNPFWNRLPPIDPDAGHTHISGHTNQKSHLHVSLDGREYVLLSDINMRDYSGKTVGKLLYAHDITELIAEGRQTVIVTVFATIVLLTLAFLILHFSFGALLTEILALNVSLKKSKNSLEEQVKERTWQLETEIEEKKQMEENLRQSQKLEALGTLAGGIAHDFNNILYAIQGYTELTRLDLPPGTPAHDNLGEVLKSCNRAAGLVKQILTFSRKGSIEKKPLLLTPIIKETLKLLRETIPTTITIKQNLDQNCPPVLADLTQASQVIINLCINAADAMRTDGGILSISLTKVELDAEQEYHFKGLQPGPYARLTVEDTGHGIDRAIREKIFEPFFTTKEVGKGTGLGLSTVFGIVKDHNGSITVESEIGRGTRFDVYLPIAEDDVENEIDTSPQQQTKGGGKHILFVDDEPEIVSFMEKAFIRMGHQVTAFTSSTQALEMFKNFPDMFDLVLTDLTMPGMTGFELSRHILAIRPNIPIVLATGRKEELTEEKATNLGISACLLKPLSIDDLAKALNAIFARR
jgi:signal transduction histidine kinase/ActR/RegA family two-component response regulator